jgi:hypothetical protein
MFPNLPNGHLYQWTTTISSLLFIASFVGIAAQYTARVGMIREFAVKAMTSDGASKDLQHFWTKQVEVERSNITTFIFFLGCSAAVGFAVALISGNMWYWNVQWYEDEERRLSRELKLHEAKLILPGYVEGKQPNWRRDFTDFLDHLIDKAATYCRRFYDWCRTSVKE